MRVPHAGARARHCCHPLACRAAATAHELCGRTCAESGRAEVFCGDFARAFSAVASTTARLSGVAGLLRCSKGACARTPPNTFRAELSTRPFADAGRSRALCCASRATAEDAPTLCAPLMRVAEAAAASGLAEISRAIADSGRARLGVMEDVMECAGLSMSAWCVESAGLRTARVTRPRVGQR